MSMIDHSQCDHPRTRSDRAKCRRARDGGDSTPKRRASTKEVDFSSGQDAGSPQTPRDKADECHVCGVERIAYMGTDAWTNIQVAVGERCRWRIARAPDFRAVP